MQRSKNLSIENRRHRKSMIATGFPYRRDDRIDEVLKPMRDVVTYYQAFRRLGSAAMDLAYVACGKCEGFYEEALKPWDTAGGSLIVREAGGKVTDFWGVDYHCDQKTILATNQLIHPDMMKLFEQTKRI